MVRPKVELRTLAAYLSDIDPLGDDFGAMLRLVHCQEHRGDDTIRHSVKLLNGGDDSGGISIARLVSSGPHGTQALMWYHTLEQFLQKWLQTTFVAKKGIKILHNPCGSADRQILILECQGNPRTQLKRQRQWMSADGWPQLRFRCLWHRHALAWNCY